MTQKIALVLKVLIIASLLFVGKASAQSCSINTNVNGIAGTGHTNGTIAQSFTACESGLLASVSAVSGNSATGFNQVIVEIFNGDGVNGTKLLTTGAVQVNANRTVTWTLTSYNVQVVAGQKYTARFTTTQGSPMLKYGTGTNSAIDYYGGGRIYYLGNTWNDMFFSASIQTLDDPTLNPVDDATDVSRSEEVKLSFTRNMEAASGNITIENVTDATSQSVDVTTLTIDGGDVYMPLTAPLLGGKEYNIEIPSGALRATNGIPYDGLITGEWTFTTSTKPYGILTTTSADLTNDAVILFTLDFSDVVTGFELADLDITNGVASNLTGSGDSYAFDVTPSADGQVIVSLPVDKVEAGASNGNEATDYSLDFDGTAPTVALSSAASGTIQTSVFDIDVAFSEEVTGFETSDLQIVNAEVLSVANTNNTLYTVSLRALAEGQITVDLAADVANDLAGNANTAAPAIIDLTYSVDLESDLLSYYPFDGDALDTVSTGFDGSVSGAVLTTGFDGTTNGAYSFDGVDQITFGDTPIGSGSFTAAFWVKIPEGLTQNQVRTILGKREACSEGRFFEISYTNSSTLGHRISVEQRNNGAAAGPEAILSGVGEWTHIAYVKDNDEQESSFYINGVQQTPVAWSTSYNFENNASLKAGISACNGSGRFRYNGDLDDLYIYGRALTAVEIDLLIPFVLKNQSIASGEEIQAGSAIELMFNKNIVQGSVNTTNITAVGSASGALNIALSPSQDGFTVSAPDGWPVDEDVTISISGLLAENGTELTSTDLVYSVVADEAAGMILHYPISGNVDEAVGEIASQDGTISGALFTEGVDGDPFGALSFDGTDDLVTLGDAPLGTSSFSYSLWVKIPADGSESANTVILSKREACTEGRMFDLFYLRSGDKVRFSAGTRSNASNGGVATGFDFPVEEWVYLTFVNDFEAKQTRLIVNGVLEGEANWLLTSINLENNAPIRLGNTPCNGVNGELRFDGMIDDFRIYNRVIEPRILSVEPSKGTVNATIDTVVTISFDRALDVSNIDDSKVSISDTEDNTYAFSLAFSDGDSVITITPDNDLPRGKEFTVSVDSLPVIVGSGFLPFQTYFTTVNTQLLSFEPANNEAGVDSLAVIAFKFDNEMDAASLSDGIGITGTMSGAVAGSFSLVGSDSVIFEPSRPYFPNEVINVYITPDLKDVGGESLSSRAMSFRVASTQVTGATLSFEMTRLIPTFSTPIPRDVVPADIDGDGDLDLVVGEEGQRRLFWIENKGFGNFDATAANTIDTGNDHFDIEVTDFDFDGDTDLVTVGRVAGKGVYWYENDGSGGFTERLIIALSGSSDLRAVEAADYNGDGMMDVAVVDYGTNRLTAYNQDGTQLFSAANVGGPLDVQSADRDDDGDLDLFLANYTGNNVAVFANSGAGTFGGLALQSATNSRTVIPIDFDKDGDLDLAYCAQTASVIGILENTGNLTYTNHQVGSVGGPHRIDVGDIDGDGDYDIVYTVAGGASEMNFYYLENNGSFGLWVAKKLVDTETFSGTFTQTAKFADIDNDGDLDVLATNGIDQFYLFENMIIDLNNGPILDNPVADQTMEEDDANGLVIDVSGVFSDAEGDPFTITAESDNAAVTAVINGNDLELNQITPDFFGEVTITLTADDGNGTNNDVFVLSITSVNDAPEFDLSAATITVDEDFTTTETITVTQNQPADEDAPSYSLSPASVSFADVSIDAATGEVSVMAVADGFGTQEFTITANDGGAVNSTATQTFILTVNSINDAPVLNSGIANVTYEEDESNITAINLNSVFSDVEDDILSLSLAVLSGSDLASVTLDVDLIEIELIANAFGTVQVEVTAEDADGATVSDVFDITINAVNDAPTFTTSGNLTLTKDFAGTESVTVSADPIPFGEESQVVTYSLSPSSVSFATVSINASSGEVSVEAVASQFGSQEFTITADDGQAANNTATQTFTLTVVDNEAPSVINTIQDTSMDEDQATLSVVDVGTLFSDPESDPLTYSVSDDFGGSVVAELSGTTLQVTPVANFNGAGMITVSASDANQSTSTSFTLTVVSVNDVPTLEESLVDQQATEDQAFSYTLPTGLFADIDGDVITITSTNAPSWLAFDGSVFSGTPANADVGTTTVDVVGSDGNGGSATTTFDLSVGNVNDAPTIVSAIDDISVDEDAVTTSINLASVFEDIDAGDQLTMTATTDANALLTLTVTGEILEIGYAADAFGSGTVTVTATDNSGALVSDEFNVTVNSVNDAPTFSLSESAVDAEQDFTETLTIDIIAGAVPQDESGQTVTYTLSSEDVDVVNASINGTTIEMTAIAEAFGEQTFTVTADDGQSTNNTHVMTFTVTVNKILSAGKSLEQALSVYPNPFADYLTIDTSEKVDVIIYTMDGKVAFNQQNVNGKLDLSRLQTGSYLLEVRSDSERTTKRIIKAN